jgi:alkylated DNA nucleotide flippase Atl1
LFLEQRVQTDADLRQRGRAAAGAINHAERVSARGTELTQRNPNVFLVSYCDCNAFAGFSRAARAAGIVVARTVIAVMSKVATVRITGSDARMAYTRLETTWPET